MENGQHNGFQSTSDNFDAENWQKSLEISAPVDLPSSESFTPNETLKSEITTRVEPIKSLQDQADTTKLGQITTIENAMSVTPVADQLNYNPTNIKTTGDRLEKSSIVEIDAAIEALNQTGNLTNFYDEVRGMTEVNLDNSFNRKLYGKGADSKGEGK